MSDIATKQTQIATAIKGASTANSLFERMKQAAEAKKKSAKTTKELLPPSVEQVIQKAHGLINDHKGWVIDFEAPSDRALWSLLGKVKGLCDEISAMPTNLYGTNDNYHPENSHVLPALIRRIVFAKKNSEPNVDRKSVV